MAKTWGVPGKRQTYLSPGEQIAKLPKVPLNANPLQSWDYKKSRYRRVDLFPKAVSENTQQGGVIPIVSDVTPNITPTNTPTPSITPTNTPTNTPTPSGIIESCSRIFFGFVGPEAPLFEFTDCSGNTIQMNGVDGWNATYCGNYASAIILSGDGAINYVGTCTDPSEYNPTTVALGYSFTDPNESCTNPTTNYYQSVGQSLVIGDSIYTDYSLDPYFYAPDGYYSDGTDVYAVTGNTGSIDSIIPCAVTPTPTNTPTNTPTQTPTATKPISVVTFTATTTWTAPSDMSIIVECWGGGGGSGGARRFGGTSVAAGGGGAGGSYAKKTISVISGETYTINVGIGGTGTNTSGAGGSNGGGTWFSASTLVFAAGGGVGGFGNSQTATPFGSGGTASNESIGDVIFSGGNGASGSTGNSGGGGGAAGSSANGSSASDNTGGTAGSGNPEGGNGANGLTASAANGVAGNITGGGASGGYWSTTLGSSTGASGARGLLKITYQICNIH